MGLKILGVCGGNGVMLHPMKNDIIANIEPRTVFHTNNQDQWFLNFKNKPIDQTEKVRYRVEDVEVIIGAPDCGHSSILSYSRAKAFLDPSLNKSLGFYITSINFYKPYIFMMENLPALLVSFPKINKAFPDYYIHIFKESVSAWGNSQITRTRLIIIGVKKNLPKKINKDIKLPKRVIPPKKSGLLIKGLEEYNGEICNVREYDDKLISLYYKDLKKISVKKARELWQTEFRGFKRWPVNNGRLKNQPGVYRNFASDFPMTVRKSDRQFNHKGYMLSPREMARIQGVPDNFKLLYESDKHQYSINKARTTIAKSPPYEIGVWFKSILTEIEKIL